MWQTGVGFRGIDRSFDPSCRPQFWGGDPTHRGEKTGLGCWGHFYLPDAVRRPLQASAASPDDMGVNQCQALQMAKSAEL